MKTDTYSNNRYFPQLTGAVFLKALAALAFFLIFWYRPETAGAGSENFLLDITTVKTSEFPKIDISLYFRNAARESQNGLSSGSFVLNENRVQQSVNVTQISQTISAALIIDSSLAGGTHGGLSKKIIETAADYLEALDKMAVFTFCSEMCAVNFTGDKSRLAGDGSDKAIDYARTPEELIAFAAEKLCGQMGKKHIVYVTAASCFIDEAVLENIKAINESDRPTVNFLKINLPNEIISSSVFGGIASSIATASGGVYREVPFKEAETGISSIMDIIKSNYRLDYISTQPYSNGRKRSLNLNVSYLDTLTSADTEYTVNFNLPELDFGVGSNPVFYQEIDPAVLERSAELGLTLSANVKFINNRGTSKETFAHIGFGAFRVNGRPEELSHSILTIDNLFNVCAARYKFSGSLSDQYLKSLPLYRDQKEKLELDYKEKLFIKSSAGNRAIKKAGIYWSPFFRDDKFNQWVRVFISFIPERLITDGSLRYAI
ncbi:MAG TPA: hypothetical protein PKL57_16730, partial [Candidatus Wallbacteria bacterium]|nr:hypothetical protein [Candidatus Wallbacteria bacterium]